MRAYNIPGQPRWGLKLLHKLVIRLVDAGSNILYSQSNGPVIDMGDTHGDDRILQFIAIDYKLELSSLCGVSNA
jgi:hypothetical protein